MGLDAGLGPLTVRDDLARDWARPSMDVGTDVVIVEEQGVTVRALRRPGEDRVLHGVIDEAFDTWPERDSRTGALGLYEHVGMAVTESFARYSLELS